MEVHNAAENDILYRKLETNMTIRLVNLPSRDNQEIDISLSNYDFQVRNEEHEALSYVWGSPVDTKPMVLKVNLSMSRGIYAISINQTDIAEWAQQVSLMALFYSQAAMVFIWIGGDVDCEAVYNFLQVAIQVRDRYPVVLTGHGHSWKAARDILESGKFEDEINATLTFLKDPWFTRWWTFQEAFLSKTATILAKTGAIIWRSFVIIMNFVEATGHRDLCI
ncbi:hypothetical protein BKA61DRAFT_700015 [Leptodontidium sp. MPI-SDFR-AT-0119]|nr:hypothetical protein BKA61DRAFT_700015 [Leptodontidium sp. MPI-SDFR-AT-0119]